VTEPAQPQQPLNVAFDRLAVLATSRQATVELCRINRGDHAGAVVAVKRLPLEYVEDPELQAMFRDEIWMASALAHPNVTRVLGWGEDTSGPYLVAEFVRGVSLARLMKTVFSTGEAFSERLIVYLATCICGGLAAAHGLRSDRGEFLNLVHRDLTPGNVLLSFEGEVKITDFGLAKAKQRATHTAIGMTKGEPAYMSPEQVCGQQLDGRSDIFALGVLLFELFAQKRPWTVTSVREALAEIVQGDTPDLMLACPRIDKTLAVLVGRCLAKKREERFQSAAELKGHFDEWLRLHGYDDSKSHLGRFVRRNAMRQMRWVDRTIEGGDASDISGSSPFDISSEMPPAVEEPPQRTLDLPPADSMIPSAPPRESVVVGSSERRRYNSPWEPAQPSEAYVTSSHTPATPSIPTSWKLAPPPDAVGASVRAPGADETTRMDRSHIVEPPRAPLSGTSGTLGDEGFPPPPSARPLDEPEAATMKRERAPTITVTAVPRTRTRDNSPPLGATGQHSVLDVRLGQGSLPLPLLDPRVAAPLSTEPEPSTVPRATPSLEQLSFAATMLIDASRDLGDKARVAAEKARGAAAEAVAAAHAADRAAEAADAARLALERALAGDPEAAGDAITRAQRLSGSGERQGSTR
jgi:serine/threonine protein kinase